MQAMIRAMETLKIPYKYEHNKVPEPFRVPRMEPARQCDLFIDLRTCLFYGLLRLSSFLTRFSVFLSL